MNTFIKIPRDNGRHVKGNFLTLPLPLGLPADDAVFLARAWFTKHHPPRYENPQRFVGAGPVLIRTTTTERFLSEVERLLGPPKVPFVYPYSNTELPEAPAFTPAPEDLDVCHEVPGVPVPDNTAKTPLNRLSRTQRLRRALFGGKRGPKTSKSQF